MKIQLPTLVKEYSVGKLFSIDGRNPLHTNNILPNNILMYRIKFAPQVSLSYIFESDKDIHHEI